MFLSYNLNKAQFFPSGDSTIGQGLGDICSQPENEKKKGQRRHSPFLTTLTQKRNRSLPLTHHSLVAYKGCRQMQLLFMQSFSSNHLITQKCESSISVLCDRNFNLNKLCFPTFYNGLNNLISQVLNEVELLTLGLKYNKDPVSSSSLILCHLL